MDLNMQLSNWKLKWFEYFLVVDFMPGNLGLTADLTPQMSNVDLHLSQNKNNVQASNVLCCGA